MSPYPPGLELPDLDRRRSCTSVWPAGARARRTPNRSASGPIIPRIDGVRPVGLRRAAALYVASWISETRRRLGRYEDGTSRRDAGVPRDPVGPQPLLPPAFNVVQSSTGRLLVNNSAAIRSTAWDGDEPGRSNCHDECLEDWTPVPAPQNVIGARRLDHLRAFARHQSVGLSGQTALYP